MRISFEDINADEFQAMLTVAEERDLLERAKLPGSGSSSRMRPTKLLF